MKQTTVLFSFLRLIYVQYYTNDFDKKNTLHFAGILCLCLSCDFCKQVFVIEMCTVFTLSWELDVTSVIQCRVVLPV